MRPRHRYLEPYNDVCNWQQYNMLPLEDVMIIDPTETEIELLLTSLKNSHRALTEAQGTPDEVRGGMSKS